jgi:DNA repair protein RecO (recombination protein O)
MRIRATTTYNAETRRIDTPATPGGVPRLAGMAGRTYKTEAIVLRSMRFSEADRILHLYTEDRGRIGAIAKGLRKTKSRFGARLEPLSHVELMLHQGAGELQTITGVELLRSHHAVREDSYRLNVGLIGAEAMLRLFGEPEANDRAFGALARFLDLLDDVAPRKTQPAGDSLALSFQLKLLWLAGYLPHVTSCVECGAGDLVGFSARAGGAVCGVHADGALRLSVEGLAGIEQLLSTPLADAVPAELSDRARRDALAVITSSYEEHGGFRLKTLSA